MVAHQPKPQDTAAAEPALLSGTSMEYLGAKPVPRRVRERPVVFVMGPNGAGKSAVAVRLAGPGALVLDTKGVQAALVSRAAHQGWSSAIQTAPALVLDGPVWLRGRPAAVSSLGELVALRAAAGLRTVICQADRDGSALSLIEALTVAQYAVLALRLPAGRRGKMRFARKLCDRMGLPHCAAKGSADLTGWSYAKVLEQLQAWQPLPFDPPTLRTRRT